MQLDYRRLERYLRGYARRRMPTPVSHVGVDDLVQEGLLAALEASRAWDPARRRNGNDDDGARLGWVMQKARWRIVRVVRHQLERQRIAPQDELTEDPVDDGTPELKTSAQLRVRELVDELPRRQWFAVRMRFWHDADLAEIARGLECTRAGASWNIKRGVELLREQMTAGT